MSAEILRGKPIADKIKEQILKEVEVLKTKGVEPFLVAVLVGENAASKFYTDFQKKNSEQLGIKYELKELPAETTQGELIKCIEDLNNDKAVSGIILQLPLPAQIEAREVQWKIAYLKDIEGVTPHNAGLVSFGKPILAPCTAVGAYELVKSTGIDLTGKEVVVIGHSDIVGKPAALLHLNDLATVTVCHIGTAKAGKTPEHVKRAEVLIVAVGVPGLIKGDWIKPGAIVIDVGINEVDDPANPGKKKIVGDVEFDKAVEVAGIITPVPGGSGTVTTAILLRNVVEAAKWQAGM
jgi:methylenetetrahydrofolate dehydrogenase (NADP+)/methenyltetrahydrofolate cyclohydrolase